MTKKSTWSFKIASIRGVALQIHFSLLFLLIYVVALASARLPMVITESGINPDLVSGSPVVWGIAFALGVFLSVTLHEYGHVFTAQSLGVRVQSVTLMMIGGVTRMDRLPDTRYAEMKVSLVGPAVSFLLAAVFFILESSATSANVALFSYWMARLNLTLGIFNLLPAFPLDGGRALRSAIAARYGSIRATEIAVRIGRGLAWALGALGFLTFNILMMLIAFFIHSAASSELIYSVTQRLLARRKVSEIVRRTPTVEENQWLSTIASEFTDNHYQGLPVMSGSKFYGVIKWSTVRSISPGNWSHVRVRDVTEPVNPVEINQSLDDILVELSTSQILPVSDQGEIIGIIQQRDLVELLEFSKLTQTEEEIHEKRAA